MSLKLTNIQKITMKTTDMLCVCRSADELTTLLGAYTNFRKVFSSMDVVINHVHMNIS